MPQIESRMRKSIAEFLPCAIEKALGSYQQFSDQETKQKSCEFKAHHDACKIAIAHIKLLIELAKWADLPDPKIEGEIHDRHLRGLIESAEQELKGT